MFDACKGPACMHMYTSTDKTEKEYDLISPLKGLISFIELNNCKESSESFEENGFKVTKYAKNFYLFKEGLIPSIE